MSQDATTPGPAVHDAAEQRLREASLAAARAEASRRFDEEIAKAKSTAKAIVDAAHDEAGQIRAAAVQEAAELQADLRDEAARLGELRAAVLALGAELRGVTAGLDERLAAVTDELAPEA